VAEPSSIERWHRLEQLLDAALDCAPEHRAALLDAACAGNAELRAEAERLLRACDESCDFLGESAGVFAAPILASLAGAGPAAAGDRIGAYRIIEEAGRGGMAVVYLAERDDGQFHKRVALKLIRANVNIDDDLLRRFRDERQILASLEHPGIARLLDGGVTEDGLPWFAMEYVAGTPIESYCDERRLSVEARLELFCAVCDAVQHAHRRGIIHRDLKPGNVLVSDTDAEEAGNGVVKLLDFGIAELLVDGSTGEAVDQLRPRPRPQLMTPDFASPEQVRGDAVTPATDVYALGVLLYRLLCGRHPYRFSGDTEPGRAVTVPEAQPEPPSAVVGQARATAVDEGSARDAEAVAVARGTEPGQLQRRLELDLDAVVLKALSKEPAQRYRDAGRFAAVVRRHLQSARDIDAPTSGAGRSLVRWPRRAGWRGSGAVLAAAAIMLAAVAVWLARGRSAAMPIDPDVIMVAPFHVAADGAFDYLREGLVDLLATSLNGATGSRAVDPRSTIAAWRRAASTDGDPPSPTRAIRVARGLGAGQLLMGSVVGNHERLTINATLYDAIRSSTLVRISVHGPADMLPGLLDQLAGQVLTREAGVPPHQLSALTTTSLPALRAYLAGRQSYRLGHRGEAVRQLEEALSHDSTFALAAIHLALAVGGGPLTAAPGTAQQALDLAWRERSRLSTQDRLFLEALAGPRFPEPAPRHERFAAYTSALNASPDWPEALMLMGTFHLGGVSLGEAESEERSAEYFARALALDSSYAVPVYNLARDAAVAGNAATVHRIVRPYLATDSTSEMAQLLAWLDVAVSGDQRLLRAMHARMPEMQPTALGWIALHAMLLGIDMAGADAALAALRTTVRSEREWQNYRFREWEYLGNRGRLNDLRDRLEVAARETEASGPLGELGMSAGLRARTESAMYRIQTSLFWGGDTSGIGVAIPLLEDAYRRTPAADGDPLARAVVAESACFAGLAHTATGAAARAHAATARLHELLDGRLELPDRNSHAACAAVLDAAMATRAGRPDARILADRADSLLLRHSPSRRRDMNRVQLVLARTFDALGDPQAGLRVIRRRQPNNPAYFLATILAEEGRLAARAGDRDGAVRAYRHYLVLRTDPDPELAAEVQQIREQLATLRAER
jgi:serine/threonine protein kinase